MLARACGACFYNFSTRDTHAPADAPAARKWDNHLKLSNLNLSSKKLFLYLFTGKK